MVTLMEDKDVLKLGKVEEVLMPVDYEAHVDVRVTVPIHEIFEKIYVAEEGDAAHLEPHNDGPAPDIATGSPTLNAAQEDLRGPGDGDRDNGGAEDPMDAMPGSNTLHFAEYEHHASRDTRLSAGNLGAGGLDDANVKVLKKGKLRTLVLSATEAVKQKKRLLKEASQLKSGTNKVWEVFAGLGRTSQAALRMGAQVETFSKKTGWDFERAKDQPDEILLSPVCKLWSPLQELSLAQYPARKAELFEARRQNHDTVLTLVAVVYESQQRAGRHAHIETHGEAVPG